jgi:hypothetical protein
MEQSSGLSIKERSLLFKAQSGLLSLKQSSLLVSEKSSLLYSLIRFRQLESTDLRDKVYTLLSISSRILKADYSLSEPEVYIEAVTRILKETNHLFLLAHAEGKGTISVDEQLPS